MIFLAVLGIALIGVAFAVYGLYFFLVLRQKNAISNFQSSILALQEKNSNSDSSLGNVSIIVNTFNEARVISRKIDNIAELDYPKQKMEVLVYDDASVDGTADIAEKSLQKNKLFGRVIKNTSRMGLNRSMNAAIVEAKNNLVCITDSDVLLEKDSLKNSVSVLQDFEGAGGVTGHIQPVFEGKGITQESETSYRGFYHKSMLAESALHSAFPGNGPLIVFDKEKVSSSIPTDYGSTDGNIAMNIIKKGLRFIYVPNAMVFEPSAENLGDQRLQKIRRSKRLQQVFLHNRDVSFSQKYGKFGSRIFPLKFLMLSLCPTLFILGLSVFVVSIILSQNILLYTIGGLAGIGIAILLVTSNKLGGFITSFGLHQLYLVIGFFSAFRKSVYWKTIDRKTEIATITQKSGQG
ncbi:MAG: hypothetical protein QG670_2669 [Thermoproteota archaeon]|nr:hypothetical protein [Thermoproteota archaeon]